MPATDLGTNWNTRLQGTPGFGRPIANGSSTTESGTFVTGAAERSRSKGIDADGRFVAPPVAARWQDLLDQMIQFARVEPKVDEDGLEWPSEAASAVCYRLLLSLRDARFQLPDRLVPGGEGGVDLVLDRDEISERFEIARDGAFQYLRYVDAKLVERVRLPAATFQELRSARSLRNPWTPTPVIGYCPH